MDLFHDDGENRFLRNTGTHSLRHNPGNCNLNILSTAALPLLAVNSNAIHILVTYDGLF